MTQFSGWSGFRDTLLTAPPKPRQDILLLTLLWALASLPWLLGNHFIPYDSFDEFYPQSRFVVDSLRRGDWPWWNPYQYAGLPVFGDPQAMLFSLHTMVGLLLGSHYTLHIFDISTLGYLLMGALAIYALGYGRGVPRVWLLSAAVVFMLGGVATGRLQHMTQILTYAWLPLLLWMILRLFEKPTIWRAVMLGLVGAFWAANANQVVVLGGIFLATSALYLVFLSKFRLRLFSFYLLAGVIMALLLLPDPYTHLTPPPPAPRLSIHESLRPMVRPPPA